MSHDHQHHHHTLAPSGQGTVMLNIGAGIGALVIHTPGRLHGHEIEVSPVTDPTHRTHAAVRARYVSGGASFAVVIDSLPAGPYTVWRDPVTPMAQIDVPDGGVAEFSWPVEAVAA
ncbi:phospholipase [Actinoplanes sp. KI2]|uniref:phospholipase n=1 Tax=Actinoplanes sp. KI2 TaxID=2983315 RepID=UPI0021D5E450|nr:phospholipase [Actinoplanes sp. KI2]MCU7728097.1 phospholipase [Actinoplanes sp. KI2]